MNQMNMQKISVVIPMLNEEESIGKVLSDLPREQLSKIIVVDNGSSDNSVQVAEEHGALVLHEPEMGYGAACLRGINYLKENDPPDILVFIDGDYSDYPEELLDLVTKINEGYDFVLGSRVLGVTEFGAELSSHSILGNKLAAFFLNTLFGGRYTDMGPFRAIRFDRLLQLEMADHNYGWTMEMQIKAERENLKTIEIPVHYRQRYGGESKVTGSLMGSIKAFSKITYVVILYFFRIR
jgi:glycosyltransferase involved in cell wall biosynthesis